MKERPILFSGPMVRAILEGRKTQTRRVVPTKIVESIEFMGGHSDENEPITSADVDLSWGVVSEDLTRGRVRETTEWRLCSAEYPEEGCIPLGPLYGGPGDLLWVRETSRAYEVSDREALEFARKQGYDTEFPPYGLDGVIYQADDYFRAIENSPEASERWLKMYHYRGKAGSTVPPIHMPRWASRLTLRITGIRVERLQEISGDDCFAEGIQIPCSEPGRPLLRISGKVLPSRFTTKRPSDWDKDDWARFEYAELWEEINGKGSWDSNPWVWVIEFERIEQSARAA